MDKIQQLIIDTYNSKPKHFSQILSRNADVLEYLKENAPHISSFLEQLYYVVYKETNICKYGNIKKLKTFDGYSFCGKTGICKCAQESVSNSVSVTKLNYTKEKNDKITASRVATNLELYGVTNAGQLPEAKSAHKLFYEDTNKVSDVTSQIKITKLANHGDENFNNRIKAEQTCLINHNVKNTWSLRADKQNPNLIYLTDKNKLLELFPRLSVEEISIDLGVHMQTVYRYLNIHGFRDPYKSSFEKEIISFIQSLGVTNIISNKRNIIDTKKEIDIFLPDYNLAIEYNGIFWHHDQIPHITKTYHYDKFIACENKNIELFSIFSDSWDNKKNIWKEKIRAKLGIYDKKIFARRTEVVELQPHETKIILDLHHIQGYCTSTLCYGLKFENEIVALMTFSTPRHGIGKDRGIGSYELVRYVTTCCVPGGASKLLSHFVKVHSPSIIYSYSSNLYSVGNLYNKLGFQLENEYKAGYWYYSCEQKRSFHRSNFTKYKLIEAGFDPALTEPEIMYNRGFLRLWDCGSRTWVLNCKKDLV